MKLTLKSRLKIGEKHLLTSALSLKYNSKGTSVRVTGHVDWNVEELKIKVIHTINQWEPEKKRNPRRLRENPRDQYVVGFSFESDWLLREMARVLQHIRSKGKSAKFMKFRKPIWKPLYLGYMLTVFLFI